MSVSLTFRPLTEFMGGEFSVPTLEELNKRLPDNLSYFAANYASLFLLLLVVLCVQYPNLFFVFIFFSAVAAFLFSIHRRTIVLPAPLNIELNLHYQALVYGVCATISFFYVGERVAIYTACLAILLSLLHACVKTRSLKSRVTTAANAAKAKIIR